MSVSDNPYPGNARARPRPLVTPIDGVTLWWCELDAEAASLPSLRAWLSPAEHARAMRFASNTLAQRYLQGRAALRWVLAQLLRVRPDEVPIERGRRGRPQLANSGNLDFNVSNTRNIAFVATATNARVGVDVESEHRQLNHVGLARKFLTLREQAMLAGMNTDEHRRAFLRLWTCKEAMSKATGDALAAPLRKLDVELSPALRLVAGPPPYLSDDWRLAAVAAPSGYLATVAVWHGATLRQADAGLDNVTRGL